MAQYLVKKSPADAGLCKPLFEKGRSTFGAHSTEQGDAQAKDCQGATTVRCVVRRRAGTVLVVGAEGKVVSDVRTTANKVPRNKLVSRERIACLVKIEDGIHAGDAQTIILTISTRKNKVVRLEWCYIHLRPENIKPPTPTPDATR